MHATNDTKPTKGGDLPPTSWPDLERFRRQFIEDRVQLHGVGFVSVFWPANHPDAQAVAQARALADPTLRWAALQATVDPLLPPRLRFYTRPHPVAVQAIALDGEWVRIDCLLRPMRAPERAEVLRAGLGDPSLALHGTPFAAGPGVDHAVAWCRLLTHWHGDGFIAGQWVAVKSWGKHLGDDVPVEQEAVGILRGGRRPGEAPTVQRPYMIDVGDVVQASIVAIDRIEAEREATAQASDAVAQVGPRAGLREQDAEATVPACEAMDLLMPALTDLVGWARKYPDGERDRDRALDNFRQCAKKGKLPLWIKVQKARQADGTFLLAALREINAWYSESKSRARAARVASA